MTHVSGLIAILAAVMLGSATALAGWNPAEQQELEPRAEATIDVFLEQAPSLKIYFDQAYGYAVFPSIGKGGVGIGASRGKGAVFEQGRVVGRATMTKFSVGLQLGGQSFSQIVFFQDKATLEDFKIGRFEFDAEASAVAIEAGASSVLDFDNGVAVFTKTRGGLMFEANLGGQKFTFYPKSTTPVGQQAAY